MPSAGHRPGRWSYRGWRTGGGKPSPVWSRWQALYLGPGEDAHCLSGRSGADGGKSLRNSRYRSQRGPATSAEHVWRVAGGVHREHFLHQRRRVAAGGKLHRRRPQDPAAVQRRDGLVSLGGAESGYLRRRRQAHGQSRFAGGRHRVQQRVRARHLERDDRYLIRHPQWTVPGQGPVLGNAGELRASAEQL